MPTSMLRLGSPSRPKRYRVKWEEPDVSILNWDPIKRSGVTYVTGEIRAVPYPSALLPHLMFQIHLEKETISKYESSDMDMVTWGVTRVEIELIRVGPALEKMVSYVEDEPQHKVVLVDRKTRDVSNLQEIVCEQEKKKVAKKQKQKKGWLRRMWTTLTSCMRRRNH